MTTIHVTASRDYDVLVQPGLLDDAGAQIARVLGTGRTAAIVAGETVAGLYAGRLAASLTRAGFRAARSGTATWLGARSSRWFPSERRTLMPSAWYRTFSSRTARRRWLPFAPARWR